MGLVEIEAREILKNYNGLNNQILEWKRKLLTVKSYRLTRSQSTYIKNYQNEKPKVARKYVTLATNFAEKLREDNNYSQIPLMVWVEKILCSSDKAYHIWGKVFDNEDFHTFWLPKSAIIPEEKKLNRVIDYTKYDVVVNGEPRSVLPHQPLAIEKLLCNDRFILADDMGLTKTGSSIIAALESGVKKILIVCPASVKINWKREIQIYSDKKIFIVDGRKWQPGYDIYIINYDIIKNFHTTDKLEDNDDYKTLINENFELAIVDEAHKLSNADTIRTKLLNDILETISKVWLLTGTPMTNRPINYFNLLKIMRSPLTLNWQSYVKRYCKGYQFTPKNSNRKIWNTSGASNLDELRERTKHLVLRRLKSEVANLPEKMISPLFLELNNTFYEDELEEFMRITEENKDKESLSVSIQRLTKIRQIIAREKIPYTCEIVDKYLNEGKKVIIFTNFTATLNELHEIYKRNSVVLDGRMSPSKRQESIDRFQNDSSIHVFIGNLEAAGAGITLTASEVTIMNDLCFVPASHLQAEDRSFRTGQKNNVIIYYPVFENTIEMIVYNILNRKKKNIDTVMGDMPEDEAFTKELLENITKKGE